MKPTAIRLPDHVLAEADRLAVTSTPRSTRTAVLREAIERGLIELRAARRSDDDERNTA